MKHRNSRKGISAPEIGMRACGVNPLWGASQRRNRIRSGDGRKGNGIGVRGGETKSLLKVCVVPRVIVAVLEAVQKLSTQHGGLAPRGRIRMSQQVPIN